MSHTTELLQISPLLIQIEDDRHIPKRPDVIERLRESMGDIGIINPITVRRNEENNGYVLIAGRNRLEASKALKWDNIPCLVLDGLDALDAEQIELCENLVRQDLTSAQQSLHYARLKEIAEIKYRLKTGRPRNDEDENSSTSEISFPNRNKSNAATAVASHTNRSASAIERDSNRVKNIPQISDTIGTSLDSGVELDALARLPEDVQRGLVQRALAGEKVSARAELKRLERAEKERALGEKQIAMPDGKFGVIYCDPPWKFKTYSEKGQDRSPENHYACISTNEIAQIPVAEMADRNCVCFMWATAPMLPDALQLMEQWGFTYKSQMIWVKDKMALGYWFRSQHEILLVGVKGLVPAPAPGSQFPSIIMAKTAEHSVKPDEFYGVIESYFPTLKKIELFARRARDGWTAWGNEAPEEEEEVSVPDFLKEGNDDEDPSYDFWDDPNL
jgi:N6-adenosine-specific RNA methylase IME4